MSDADEALPKDTDEAEEDAEERKEEEVDDPAQEHEKEVTMTKEPEMPKTRIKPPFPRRVARNMEEKVMSELLKVFKNEDNGMFLIPCDIGNAKIGSVLLNMEDSYNIMPLTMYQKLKLNPLKSTNVMIRLADMSRAYPVGIAKGVLVKVKDLILHTDFYVLNVGDSQTRLGRPFLEAIREKIDCDARKPTCQIDGEMITFNLLKAEEKQPCTEGSDLEDNEKPIVEDILSQGKIQDSLGKETTD